MVQTKNEIEAKLRRLAEIIDNSVVETEGVLTRLRLYQGDFGRFVRFYTKKAEHNLKKRRLDLEIRLLKRKLAEIDEDIRLKKKGERSNDP